MTRLRVRLVLCYFLLVAIILDWRLAIFAQIFLTEVVEGHILQASFLNSLLCHVNHSLVQAIVQLGAKVKLFPNRL